MKTLILVVLSLVSVAAFAANPAMKISGDECAKQMAAVIILFPEAEETRLMTEFDRLWVSFARGKDPVMQSSEVGTFLALLAARNLGLLNPVAPAVVQRQPAPVIVAPRRAAPDPQLENLRQEQQRAAAAINELRQAEWERQDAEAMRRIAIPKR